MAQPSRRSRSSILERSFAPLQRSRAGAGEWIAKRGALRLADLTGCSSASGSLTDASEHDDCRPPPRPKDQMAFVLKADRASRIERVRIENAFIGVAVHAAGRLIAGHAGDPDRRSAGAGRSRRPGWSREAHRPGLSLFALGGRLALPTRRQDKGGQGYQERETHESPQVRPSEQPGSRCAWRKWGPGGFARA